MVPSVPARPQDCPASLQRPHGCCVHPLCRPGVRPPTAWSALTVCRHWRVQGKPCRAGRPGRPKALLPRPPSSEATREKAGRPQLSRRMRPVPRPRRTPSRGASRLRWWGGRWRWPPPAQSDLQMALRQRRPRQRGCVAAVVAEVHAAPDRLRSGLCTAHLARRALGAALRSALHAASIAWRLKGCSPMPCLWPPSRSGPSEATWCCETEKVGIASAHCRNIAGTWILGWPGATSREHFLGGQGGNGSLGFRRLCTLLPGLCIARNGLFAGGREVRG
jgi:hypothetical protein